MANWYVSSSSYTAVTQWAASTAYTVGQIVRQLAVPAVNSERCFRCTTAGTTGASEPSWNLGRGATTTSGTATFAEVTGQEVYQASGAWAAPYARIGCIQSVAGADNVLLDKAHAETQAAGLTINLAGNSLQNPISILCVDPAGAVPPAATTVGASVTSSGGTLTIQGYYREIRGVTFAAGGGISVGNGYMDAMKLVACSFVLTGSNSNAILFTGANYAAGHIVENCSMTFSTSSQYIRCYVQTIFKNCPSFINGTTPTSGLLNWASGPAIFEGCDLSALGTNALVLCYFVPWQITLRGCRIPAGFNPLILSVGNNGMYGQGVDVVGCDSGGSTLRNERYRVNGTLLTSTSVARNSGAMDTGVAVSHAVTTFAQPIWWQAPFESFAVAQWFAGSGATVTVTVEGVANAATLPNNDDAWIAVSYQGTAGSTRATLVEGTKAGPLAANAAVTASTAAWDAASPARTNSTAYAVGQPIKLASNAGRVFFCTSAGTSAASEPAGYAAAADGGSVTDGGATFRAGVRFKLTASIAPAVAALVTATAKIAKPSTTVFLDPLLTIA